RQHPDVVRNFVKRNSKLLQRAMAFNDRIMSRQRLEFIRSRNKRKSGKIRNILSDEFVITFWGVKSGPNCSSAECNFLKMIEGVGNGFHRIIKLCHVARKFLT